MALPVCVCGHVHEVVLSPTRYAVGPADTCGAMLDPDTKRLCQCQAYCPSGPIHSERGFVDQEAREKAHQAAFGEFLDGIVNNDGDPEC